MTNSATKSRFLDPSALAKLANLPLVARRVVEGFLSGRHKSPFHGFSVEFLDHRPYAAGDELRAVDWKVVARTDRYFVKRFEQETNLRATLALDISRSMAFGKGVDKLNYGGMLSAALAYLLLRQNDAVGLALFDANICDLLPPRAHPTQFARVVERLDGIQVGGASNVANALHQLADRVRRRGLIVVISDFIDNVEQIADALEHFRHNGHDAIVFQVLSDTELTLPFDRRSEFHESETGLVLTADPGPLRQRYLEKVTAFTQSLRAECLGRKIGYELMNTQRPYDAALAAFLDKRARLG